MIMVIIFIIAKIFFYLRSFFLNLYLVIIYIITIFYRVEFVWIYWLKFISKDFKKIFLSKYINWETDILIYLKILFIYLSFFKFLINNLSYYITKVKLIIKNSMIFLNLL